MSKVIGIVIFLILGFGGMRFAAYYREVNDKVDAQNNRWNEPVNQAVIVDPGMPASLEPLLEAAKAKGAGDLKKWLDQYRTYVKEPRLSEIELDYVKLVGRSDPPEARRVFAVIKARNADDSPLAEQIAKLAKTYQ
ncbi:hypothetical protein N8494_00960 [bacterium]|jgi:hypothetical protein|nr:hypothetical protein [Verrucomicrobiota bacterium]MDA7497261.1 hypothetical protein [bacterium]MDA7633747.1 hypothetical protein [bacterium]MDA7866855.1 hypothetical protein [Verrucomicrobiota bacterium]